ncbi:MAG TPA: iron ABC transporter permease [Methanospirillum sp.]|nr:iron ABC transporter permease [Methanospirillum sp.]
MESIILDLPLPEPGDEMEHVGNSGRLAHRILILFLLILPIPSIIISLFIGSYGLSPGEVIAGFLAVVTGSGAPGIHITVLMNMRLPRIVLALLVGAALSVSGACFQGIFRNPLVSPDILGLSSGAAFGAALAVSVFYTLPIQVSAFIFSLVALGIAYLMAYQKGETPVISLVLSGVITSFVFSALLTAIQFAINERALQSIVFWMMGSLNTASWYKVNQALPWILIGIGGITMLRWQLNILALGDDDARSVGMRTELMKAVLIIFASLAASAAVAAAGIISLVGLIVPHMVRMIAGPDHRIVIPLSITVGASFLVLVDDLSRSLFWFELPVGILTTLVGAPVFMYLMRKTRTGGWE